MRLPRHPRPRVLARADRPRGPRPGKPRRPRSSLGPPPRTLVDGVDVARILVGGFVGGHPRPLPLRRRAAAAVAGARLVVFAATASSPPPATRTRWTHLGCAATARACVAAGVPRASSSPGAGVTRRARAYRFPNLFGRRRDAKVAGEAALRAVFREASRGSGSFSSKKRVADEEEEGENAVNPAGPPRRTRSFVRAGCRRRRRRGSARIPRRTRATSPRGSSIAPTSPRAASPPGSAGRARGVRSRCTRRARP